MLATYRGIAGIVRAAVAVVAVRGRPADAGARGAHVVVRTGVPVVACRCVIREDANASLTRIVRAHIAVVALASLAALDAAADRRPGANSARADIATGAGVTVVAWVGVVGVLAARGGVARVIRAHVAVVAVQRCTAADPTRAGVVGGTHVPVVTRRRVVGVEAAAHRTTEIVRAAVPVIAIRRGAAYAHATRAEVGCGACVAIVARVAVVYVVTALDGVTGIVGTDVAVVAVGWRTAHARAEYAGIIRSTGVIVAALSDVVRILATLRRVAGIVGAYVSVVAVRRRSSQAGSARTCVARGARIPIVALVGVVGVRAAVGRIAPVTGADVAVVAIDRSSTAANAAQAYVAGGACVPIVARRGVVGEHADATLARVVRTHVAIVALAALAALNTAGYRRSMARTA